jgi:hypothetical protein
MNILLNFCVRSNIFFKENAALVDQVAQIQENILCVKEERRFLLKKLIEHDPDLGGEMMVVPSFAKKVPVVKKKADGSVKKTGKKYKQQQQEKPESPPPAVAPIKKPMTIQFDQITNHPIYPICIGLSDFDLTVFNLGRIICDKPAFHTETAM